MWARRIVGFTGGSSGCNKFGYFELLANDLVETTAALRSTLATASAIQSAAPMKHLSLLKNLRKCYVRVWRKVTATRLPSEYARQVCSGVHYLL